MYKIPAVVLNPVRYILQIPNTDALSSWRRNFRTATLETRTYFCLIIIIIYH
jgi:hypothetical protein